MKTQTKKVNHPTMTNQSTHFTQEERYINSISNQNKNKRNYNKTYSNGFKQSPKIFSEKIRFLKNKNDPKLFSLLDIDDKKTNARGTSIPNQYKRLTDEEIKKKFEVSYTIGWNYDKNFMKKIQENTEKLKNDYINMNYINNNIRENNEIVKNINKIEPKKNNYLNNVNLRENNNKLPEKIFNEAPNNLNNLKKINKNQKNISYKNENIITPNGKKGFMCELYYEQNINVQYSSLNHKNIPMKVNKYY